MKVKIKEKFEATIYNPATRNFEGGSWHARVTIDGKLPITEIKKIQNIIDEFDHSSIVPDQFVKEEEIKIISKRYTVLRNCNQLSDMLIGVASVIIEKLKKTDEKLAMRTIMIEFWRDNNDVEFEIERYDLDSSSVEIVAHRAEEN